MNTKTLNKTINLLVSIHKNSPLIKTFCIVGSFNKSKSKSHDIDCICISERNVDNYYFNNLQYLIKEKIVLKRSDNSLRLFIKETEFGLVYFLKDQFYKYVDDIIQGKIINIKTKSWVIGGEIPEVLLTDIFFADIKFDKENELTNLQRELKKNYPTDLKKNLIRDLGSELNSKMKAVEESLINKDYLRFELGINDILLICIRLMFAKNNSYLPPIKHLTDGLYDIPKVCRDNLDEIILSVRVDEKKERLRLIKKVSSNLLHT